MDEKQIAEIDARIAPIFRAVDAFSDLITAHTTNNASQFRENVYYNIYDFCEVVIEQLGKLSPRNDYLLLIISGKAGVNVDTITSSIFRLTMELAVKGLKILRQDIY
jgi:hypothetical protein